MKIRHRNIGTCSREVQCSIKGNKVYDVSFTGGCNGNLQGISKLVEGMDVDTVIQRLLHIDCNYKGTSCPDQLAQALIEWKEKQNK